MDLGNITFGDGLVLTSPLLEGKFVTITGHQITRQDLAEGFAWASELDLDGHGTAAQRHINGNLLVDARFCGAGNNSDAIQRAIDWIVATTEGTGTVLLNPLNGQWAMTATINVPSGIRILAHPAAQFSLDFNGYAFTLAAGAADVLIAGLVLDGNARTGGLVDVLGDTDRITIARCQMGLDANPGASYARGYLFNGQTAVHDRLTVRDCLVLGGGAIVAVDDGDDIHVLRNRIPDAAQRVGTPIAIDLIGGARHRVIGNHVFGHDGTTPFDRILNLDTCTDPVVQGNWTIGGRLASIRVKDTDRGMFRGNDFLQGGTGSVASDSAIVSLVDDCDDNVFDSNLISGDTALAATVPIVSALWALQAPATGTPGSGTVLTNNIFSTQTNSSAVAGTYRVGQGLVIDLSGIGTTVQHGNTFMADMTLSVAIAGGAATENLAVPGLPSTGFAVKSIGATYSHATNRQGILIVSKAANQVTIARTDGTNLLAGLAYIQVDG